MIHSIKFNVMIHSIFVAISTPSYNVTNNTWRACMAMSRQRVYLALTPTRHRFCSNDGLPRLCHSCAFGQRNRGHDFAGFVLRCYEYIKYYTYMTVLLWQLLMILLKVWQSWTVGFSSRNGVTQTAAENPRPHQRPSPALGCTQYDYYDNVECHTIMLHDIV